MNRKEEIKNNILLQMKCFIDDSTSQILEKVLVNAFYNIDIVDMETLPVTADMSNEYIWNMFEMKRNGKLAIETIGAYKNTLQEFTSYVNKSFIHVEQNDIEYYLMQKQIQGNCPSSLNNKIKKLSAFFSWMRKNHIITINPAECIERYTVDEKPIDHLEPFEIEQLKKGCKHKRDRALIEWLRCTATRGGEIPDVRINQVDWNTGKVVIYGRKGHAYRTVYLDRVAIGYIREYIAERGVDLNSDIPLFTRLRGDKTKGICRETYCNTLKIIAKRAKVTHNIYTHIFRKTVATQICRRGGSESDAGDYLGHKPVGVTGKSYIFKNDDRILKIFQDCVQAV